MSVEVKLVISFLLAGGIFLYMEYLQRKKIKEANRRFEEIMKRLEEKAEREKNEK